MDTPFGPLRFMTARCVELATVTRTPNLAGMDQEIVLWVLGCVLEAVDTYSAPTVDEMSVWETETADMRLPDPSLLVDALPYTTTMWFKLSGDTAAERAASLDHTVGLLPEGTASNQGNLVSTETLVSNVNNPIQLMLAGIRLRALQGQTPEGRKFLIQENVGTAEWQFFLLRLHQLVSRRL